MIRVAHVAGEPTASRVPQLDLLAARPEIALTVYYCATEIQGRPWALTHRHDAVYLRGPSLPTTAILQHDYPLTPSIWGHLERGGFDCLVIGGWSVFGAQLAMLWARRRRVPYVLFAESHLGEDRSLVARAIRPLIVGPAVRGAAAHLVTGSLARDHAVHYDAPPARIWRFPNTIDVHGYEAARERLRPDRARLRASVGIAADAVVVLYVGRLLPVKGPDLMVDAVARARGHSSAPIHLHVAGDGPERPAIERRAAELGVPVTFLGFVQGERLLEAYAVADVFGLLSRRETWGIVVNEAMAFGLPLVLSRAVGAGADLLEEGGNGFAVEVGDAEAAGRAIGRLADDRSLRERLGHRSSEAIRAWDYESSVDEYLEAVEAAVQAGGRAPRVRREATG